MCSPKINNMQQLGSNLTISIVLILTLQWIEQTVILSARFFVTNYKTNKFYEHLIHSDDKKIVFLKLYARF